MIKNLISSLVFVGAALASLPAAAQNVGCTTALTSGSSEQRSCYQLFDNLAPGVYKVGFEYQAVKNGQRPDRNLRFNFLFASEEGPLTFERLSDSTSTTGWNSFSFLTQAGGDAFASFFLIGRYSNQFSLELQNIYVAAVPEPTTYLLLLAGLGVVVFVARRRQLPG